MKAFVRHLAACPIPDCRSGDASRVPDSVRWKMYSCFAAGEGFLPLQLEKLQFNLLDSLKKAHMGENNCIKSNCFTVKPLSTQKELDVFHVARYRTLHILQPGLSCNRQGTSIGSVVPVPGGADSMNAQAMDLMFA